MFKALTQAPLRALRNERGETLMTVLVASALVGMIMLAVAASITSAQKGAAGVEQQLGAANISQGILGELSDDQACKNSLGGKNITNNNTPLGTVSAIYDKTVPKSNDTRVYIVGNKYENNHLTLEKLELINYDNTAGNEGTVVLRAKITKVTQTPGTPYFYREIKVKTWVDGSGNIDRCAAFSAADSLWKEVASLNGDIYYDAGKVGVGTSAPVASLHIANAGYSNQTNFEDSNTAPIPSGAGQTDKGILLDAGYTDGRWRTRLVTVDRGNNIPLYIQQSGSTANTYTNLVRFGTHQYSANAFAVFGDSTMTGKLGIGTDAPNVKLEVKAGVEGQTAPVEAIRIWGPNTPTSANSAQDLRWTFAAAGSTKIRSYRGGSWDTYMQFLTNPVLPAADNPQVRMHIDQTGDIGVGTTAPGPHGHGGTNRVLEVNNPATAQHSQAHVILSSGAATAQSSSIGTLSWALPTAASANDLVGYIAQWTGATSTSARPVTRMGFATTSKTETASTVKMVIDEDGQVGIGNTNPGVTLDVNGYIHVSGKVTPNMPYQGGYVSWNNTNGVGEMDFISHKGGGPGGFYFYNVGGVNPVLATNTPPLFKIDADGSTTITKNLSVAGDTTATNFYANSDERLKKDIRPLENSLEKVLSLEGMTYSWRNPASGSGPQLGLIAQKVREVYPEAVHENDKGFLSVSYQALIAPLIEAFKAFYREWIAKSAEQDRRIEALENELKTQREEFSAALRTQREEIEALKASLRPQQTGSTKSR